MLRTGPVAALLLAGCADPPVRRDLDTTVQDKELEAQIRWMISHDSGMPELRHRDIKVECIKGTVVLTGVVKSPTESRRTAEIADAGGARNVVNRLEIRSDEN